MHRLRQILILILFVCWGHPLALPAKAAMSPERPLIESGRLDLSNHSWKNNPKLDLSGEWLWVPEVFLTPRAAVKAFEEPQLFGEKIFYIDVIGSFQDLRPRQAQPNFSPESQRLRSYGTYLLRIDHLRQKGDLALERLQVYTSARIFWFPLNADLDRVQPLISAGHPSSSRASSRSNFFIESDRTLPTGRGAGSYIMMIHAANFDHHWGGIWVAPKIGRKDLVLASRRSAERIEYFVLGALALITLYNLSLFWQRREDVASLLLAMFALTTMLRLVAISQFSVFVSPHWPWFFDLQWSIEVLTIYWPGLLFASFLMRVFPTEVSAKVQKFYFYLAIILTMVILFTDTYVFSHLVPLCQLYVGSLALYCFATIVLAYMRNRPGSGFSIVGAVFLILGLFHDILQSTYLTWLPAGMISWAIVVFTIFQSQIIGVRFANAFRKAQHLSRALQQEVDRQTRDIRSILSSMKQGILTIRDGCEIGDDYSVYLESILQQEDLSHRNIFEVLFEATNLSGDDKNKLEASLEFMIGEDELAFESNEHCLPRELIYASSQKQFEKLLELDWSAIVNPDGSIVKILLCIRDVTLLRKLQEEADAKQIEIEIIGKIIAVPELRFLRFITQAKSFVHECKGVVQTNDMLDAKSLRSLYIKMHTLKGMARNYDFSHISDRAHAIESVLAAEDGVMIEALRTDLAELSQLVDRYYKLATEKLGWTGKTDMIPVERPVWRVLVQSLREHLTEVKPQAFSNSLRTMSKIINNYYFIPIELIVEEMEQGIESIATELQKPVPKLEIDADGFGLSEDGASILRQALTHLVRNSLDHGLEANLDQLRQGQVEPAQISIKAYRGVHQLVLSYADNGRGLNLQRIKQMARSRLSMSKVDLDQMGPKALAELIFKPGFSTKEQVTRISGRGVGMDAVRVILEQSGASIGIEDCRADAEFEPGFYPARFLIYIPTEFYGEIDLAS